MKKYMLLMTLFVWVLMLAFTIPAKADGPPPPPPNHSVNGNQASPGGTGCPIDRTQGIVLAMTLCLAYAGFSLIKKGRLQGEQISDK